MDNKFLIKDGNNASWEIPNGYPWKEIIPTVIIDNETISFVDDGSGAIDTTYSFKLVEGQAYKVVWDGEEYNCTCELLESAYLTLGNLATNGLEDTGEPFLFIDSVYQRGIMSLNGAGEHTVTLAEETVVYHTVDSNFLPIVTEENAGAIKIYNFPGYSVDVATMKEAVMEFEAGKCRIFWHGYEFLDAYIDSSDNLFVIKTSEPGLKCKYEPRDEYGTTIYHHSIGIYLSSGTVRCNELYIGNYKITVNDDGTLSATEVTN